MDLCHQLDKYATSIGSLGSILWPASMASLAIRSLWSSPSSGAEKNGLWGLWSGVCRVLRSKVTPCPRPLLWRQARLSRFLHSSRRVFVVRGVKTERLDWLANNPFYTKRFAFFVGRRCRDSSVKAVAEELTWIGIPSRSWTSSTWPSNSDGPASLTPGRSASTKSPSAKATATALWSAT